MTPTDALIEKMARAIYALALYDGAVTRSWDDASDLLRTQYRKLARAAYEAEHEETKG